MNTDTEIRRALTNSFIMRVTNEKVKSINFVVRNRNGIRSLVLWDSGFALGNMWTGMTEREATQNGTTISAVIRYLEEHGARKHSRITRNNVG
jgi:hypothetical protein